MKGLPLAYNKDMQEDKEPVFDAIDTVELCLPVFSAMLDTLTVKDRSNMRKAAAGGFINATDCADYLAKKGMPFREAYMIVGQLVDHVHQDRGDPGRRCRWRTTSRSPEYFERGRVRGPGAGDLRQRPQGLRRPRARRRVKIQIEHHQSTSSQERA